MILKPLARTGEACPGCADGGLPGGLLKTREDPGDLRSAKQVSEANWGCSRNEDSKGRFCASKSFESWLIMSLLFQKRALCLKGHDRAARENRVQ